MANTDPLILLIKSLFQSDKKNLIRYSTAKSGKEEPKYLKLFRELDSSGDIDEEKIIKKLGISNYPEAKRRLMEQILESLINYDEGIKDSLIMERYKIEELHSRGIYRISLKRLRKALDKAYGEEKFVLVIEMSDLMNRILLESEEYKKLGLELSNKFLGRDVAKDQLSNLLSYKDLFNYFYPTFRKYYTARGQVEMKLIEQLGRHPLLSGPNMALSIRARIYYYRLRYIINLFSDDYNACLESCSSIIGLFQENPHLIREDPKLFIQEVGIQSSLQFILKRMDEGLETLDLLKTIKPNSKRMAAEIFEWIFKGKLTYALGQGKHLAIIQQMDEIKKELKEYEGLLKIEALYLIYFSLSTLLYRADKIREAVKSIRHIIDNPDPEIRADIQAVSRIILLIFYLDLEEFSLAESLSRSSTKFLKKSGKLFKFETRMLKFSESFPLPDGNTQKKAVYTTLKDDLVEMFKSPYEEKVLKYFDFMKWVNDKIEALENKTKG